MQEAEKTRPVTDKLYRLCLIDTSSDADLCPSARKETSCQYADKTYIKKAVFKKLCIGAVGQMGANENV